MISLRSSLFETSLAALTHLGNLNTMQNMQYRNHWVFREPEEQNIFNALRKLIFNVTSTSAGFLGSYQACFQNFGRVWSMLRDEDQRSRASSLPPALGAHHEIFISF